MKKINCGRRKFLRGVSTLDFKKRMISLFLIFLSTFGNASAGHSILDRVDPSFNPEIVTNLYGSKTVQQLETLPDGKILAFGNFNSYNRIPTGRLVRLNADGALDASFNNQIITSSGTCDPRTKIVIQPDGKIILACDNMVANGQAPKNLLRLNPNGTPDASFNYTLGSHISGIALDSLGRIAVHGGFQTAQGFRSVVRLNSNGSLDNSFNYTINLATVYMTSQGSRVVVGDTRIIRLNENGSEDSTFATSDTSGSISQVLTQPDNKILYLKDTGIYRLNENGGNDASFQTTNFSISGNPTMKLAAGKIVVSAQSNSSTFRRFLANGGVDASFAAYNFPASANGSFAVQPDGSLILGDFYTPTTTHGINNFIRLTSAGAPDPTFNSGGGIAFQTILPGSIRAIEPLSNGKIFLGGKFDAINNLTRPKIARLNADSTVDSSFQINTSGGGNHFSIITDVYHIRAQTDGKIIVSGWSDYVANGITKKNLVRLHQDGSIDATFNLTETINDWSEIAGAGRNRFVIFSDGKPAIGISRLNNLGPVGPLKFNQNGSLDASFTSVLNSQSPQMFIDDVALQSDGKMLVAGSHNPDNNGHKTFVARLNADGSIDATFQYTEETGRLKPTLALLPNDKILVGKHANGGSPATVKRLNANGSPDASFNSVSLPNGIVNALLALPNGKIFVGGNFTISINGQTGGNLLRLSENGSIEPTIYNLNEEVLSLAVDGEGRVLVGGVFTVINAGGGGANRTYIARITDSLPRFDFDGDGKADISVFRPESGAWYLQQSNNGFAGVTFGQNDDRVVPADYDGDGKSDVAVFRSGVWYLNRSTLGFTGIQFGLSGDIPNPADFDGDGRADLAVFRPSNGAWYVQGSSVGFYGTQFGQNGDRPVAADYDGDGKADIAVYRAGVWYLNRSTLGFTGIQFGAATDLVVPADYDGDGKIDLGVFRPSEGAWYLQQSTAGFTGIRFGQMGDAPAPADYDGDGKADLGVFRNGTWYLQRSTAGFTGVTFGSTGDKPVPNAFVQ